jgi:predicted secreted hydrolase
MTPKKSSKPKIRFPSDEGAHPSFIVEWWYGHFSLSDPEGREYGVMVAYFNFGLKILAISDFSAGKSYDFASGSTLHCVEKRLDLRWGRDHWFRTDPESFSYQLESYGGELGLNLTLVSEKPPLLGCGKGLIEWSGGSSYYYSQSRLKTKGEIKLASKAIKVEGVGFTDHQWMNYLGEGGWDWFAVQLDNNCEMVFWHVVNPDESIKTLDLTVMFADNSVYHTQNFALRRLKSWVSPQSGRGYGVLWRLQHEALGLDLKIEASPVQQEIQMFETLSFPSFYFWEGKTTVSGKLKGRAVSGAAYAEFVRLSGGSE